MPECYVNFYIKKAPPFFFSPIKRVKRKTASIKHILGDINYQLFINNQFI